MRKILHRFQDLLFTFSNPLKKTYVANVCGHKTKKTGLVLSKNGRHTMSMPISENGNPDYCIDCISKMTIRCAWCGDSIHIGDPVTLYVPNEIYKIPEYAVKYKEDERCFVGCLGWDCASSGADRQGFWMPPGKVSRVPSPIEMLLSGKNIGRAVIIGDLSDPSDIGKVI